jgi:SAM-dependent methyltransferase
MQKPQYKIMAGLEDSHWWFLAKRQYIKSLLPVPAGNLQILDIGCGTGGTTQFLKQWGEVYGIEQSKFAFPYLNKRNIQYASASIEKYAIPRNKYQLVCLFDVLYHKNIIDDQAVLNKIYAALRSGGLLCITDCALPLFTSHHDVVMNARERYTRKEMVAKVEEAGFYILRSSYIYFFVFILFVFQRTLDKFFPISTVTTMPKVINNALLSLCKLGAWVLRYISLPIGSSIIIIAQKQPITQRE